MLGAEVLCLLGMTCLLCSHNSQADLALDLMPLQHAHTVLKYLQSIQNYSYIDFGSHFTSMRKTMAVIASSLHAKKTIKLGKNISVKNMD